MSKTFRINGWSTDIEEFNAVKRTPSFVTFINKNGKEEREAFRGNYGNHFSTKEEAIMFLKEKAKNKTFKAHEAFEEAVAKEKELNIKYP